MVEKKTKSTAKKPASEKNDPAQVVPVKKKTADIEEKPKKAKVKKPAAPVDAPAKETIKPEKKEKAAKKKAVPKPKPVVAEEKQPKKQKAASAVVKAKEPKEKKEKKPKSPEKPLAPPAAAEKPAVKVQVKPPEHAKIEKTPEKKKGEVSPLPPAPAVPSPERKIKGNIRVNELTTVRELAEKMSLNPGDIIKKLMTLGTLATINQRLEYAVAELLAQEFDYETKFVSIYEGEAISKEVDDPSTLKPRPSVVTIMGHVDHGKTSLLDAIRETDVAGKEAGGITQHIGAYKVKTEKGSISFLDTPGHEAFTAMRSRGAQATDIVVLVVAADDGVMPQTVEAIDHARAAGVPIVVAINKIDAPGANAAQVKQELNKYNLVPEEWGGDTITVEVSAKTKANIPQLLEMLVLKSEMMELKANPDCMARGVVVEAKLDHKRGHVITVLIQKGTLHIGDNFVVGTTFGKVRAMQDDRANRLEVAPPSTPVEILGVNALPQSGDQFIVVEDERKAREIAQSRHMRARAESLKPRHHLSLEDISLGKTRDLRVILKADVQGSLEALRDSLEKLSTSEINLKIIHGGIGSINESDIALAAASDTLIIGFNIKPDTSVDRMAEKEGVSIRIYRIIYEVIADVKSAMEGLLDPHLKEVSLGRAQVKQVFRASKIGTVAGCTIIEGKIQRGCKVRLLRDNVIVFEGNVATLRRFKDDVKEVDKGFECGIGLEKFSDIKDGDILEGYIQEKIARTLD